MAATSDIKVFVETLNQIHLVAAVLTSFLSSIGVSALIRLFFERSNNAKLAKLAHELQKDASDRQISFNRNFDRIETSVSALYKDLSGLKITGSNHSKILQLGDGHPFSGNEVSAFLDEYYQTILRTKEHLMVADLYLSEHLITKIESYVGNHTQALSTIKFFREKESEHLHREDEFKQQQFNEIIRLIEYQAPLVLRELKEEFRLLLGMQGALTKKDARHE